MHDFSRDIIGKQSQQDELNREFDVNILVLFFDDSTDKISVTGKPSCVADAIAYLKAKVNELMNAQQKQVCPRVPCHLRHTYFLPRVMSLFHATL